MEPNFMTPEELRAVADACDSLRPLWETMVGPNDGGISVGVESVADIHVDIHDSNGELLGYIAWADNSAAFYPNVDNG